MDYFQGAALGGFLISVKKQSGYFEASQLRKRRHVSLLQNTKYSSSHFRFNNKVMKVRLGAISFELVEKSLCLSCIGVIRPQPL